MLQPKQQQEHGNADQQAERRVYRPQRMTEQPGQGGKQYAVKENDVADKYANYGKHYA